MIDPTATLKQGEEEFAFDLPELFILARSAAIEQHLASLMGQGTNPDYISAARFEFLAKAAPRKVMFAIARLTEAIELLEIAKHSVRDLSIRGKIDHLLSGALTEADIAKVFPDELFPRSIEAMQQQVERGMEKAREQGAMDAAPSSTEPTVQ